MSRKIGIIGLGFLGQSLKKYLIAKKGIKPYCFDKKGIGSEQEVNKADIVFICVNTPFDDKKKNIDLSYVESAIRVLNGEKIIVIRSTVPPGTTEFFQKKFNQHKFVFSPEFLRAATPYKDFTNPSRQIIGFTKKSKYIAKGILSLLPKAPKEYTKIIPANIAELVKYAANIVLATKVALGSKIFDFSKKLGINYNEIKYLVSADKRISPYGLEIMYEGFRGYNGNCFPKDVRTLIALGKKLGVNVKWLEDMDNENIALLKKQGLSPNYGHPEHK